MFSLDEFSKTWLLKSFLEKSYDDLHSKLLLNPRIELYEVTYLGLFEVFLGHYFERIFR